MPNCHGDAEGRVEEGLGALGIPFSLLMSMYHALEELRRADACAPNDGLSMILEREPSWQGGRAVVT